MLEEGTVIVVAGCSVVVQGRHVAVVVGEITNDLQQVQGVFALQDAGALRTRPVGIRQGCTQLTAGARVPWDRLRCALRWATDPCCGASAPLVPGDSCTALVQAEQGNLSGRNPVRGQGRLPAADTSGVRDCPGLAPLRMKAQIFLQSQRRVADPQQLGAHPTTAHPRGPSPRVPQDEKLLGEKQEGSGEALTTGMQLPMTSVPGQHLLLCLWGLQWVLRVLASTQLCRLTAGCGASRVCSGVRAL